jgi:hypothetical protein
LADKTLAFPLRKKRKRRNGTRTSAAQKPAQSVVTSFPALSLFFAQICGLPQYASGGLHARNAGTKTGTVISEQLKTSSVAYAAPRTRQRP